MGLIRGTDKATGQSFAFNTDHVVALDPVFIVGTPEPLGKITLVTGREVVSDGEYYPTLMTRLRNVGWGSRPTPEPVAPAPEEPSGYR